jgi:hypothetical protein
MKKFLALISIVVMTVGCATSPQNAEQSTPKDKKNLPPLNTQDTVVDAAGNRHFCSNGNPIFRHEHTADPAALVYNDTIWLFAGRDFKGDNGNGYVMKDWVMFSTTDMVHWTEYPIPLTVDDFAWDNSHSAWASQVIPRNGKFYWYTSTNWCGIGVAVSDKITGPYKDAIGKPLVTTEEHCKASKHAWASIDPTVFIEDDGQAYLIWGNSQCYICKLKDNMTELDGEPSQILFEGDNKFTEAPWIYKYNGKYYLAYASDWPEKIAYAVSDKIEGPYKCLGIISEIAGNCNTTHPAIINYKGQWIFISHNGGLPDGASFSRSVIAEYMTIHPDGTIDKIHPSSEGVRLDN